MGSDVLSGSVLLGEGEQCNIEGSSDELDCIRLNDDRSVSSYS
jgi:hypothetical protein